MKSTIMILTGMPRVIGCLLFCSAGSAYHPVRILSLLLQRNKGQALRIDLWEVALRALTTAEHEARL